MRSASQRCSAKPLYAQQRGNPRTDWRAGCGGPGGEASTVGEIERTGISAPRPEKLFTLVRGTTSPGSAAIVRDHCRENSRVELRRDKSDPSSISVWLLCPSLRGLVHTRKRIGDVPEDVAAALLPGDDRDAIVVARGTVKAVYAPARDEAVVTVEIEPLLS